MLAASNRLYVKQQQARIQFHFICCRKHHAIISTLSSFFAQNIPPKENTIEVAKFKFEKETINQITYLFI